MTQEQKNRAYPYYKKLLSSCLLLIGAFLMMEHLWTFDGFDLFDWIGHEYFGMAMIIAGFLLSMKWGQWKELKLWIFKNQFR